MVNLQQRHLPRSASLEAFLNARRFIFISTLVGLFSSHFFFFSMGTVHLLFFYLLIALNLMLIWSEGKGWFPNGLVMFFLFLLLTGVVGFASGTDQVGYFLKSYVGILLTATYFFAFVRYMQFDVERMFAMYARLAYYVAVLGIVLLPLQFALIGLPRLASIMTEPAEFALVCGPAVYYFADQWQRERTGGLQCLVLLIAVVLTGSSSGLIGMALGLFLFGMRFTVGRYAFPILVGIVLIFTYRHSEDFRMRFDDTLGGLTTADVSNMNMSSFALVSNTFVTTQVLTQHPLLGGGLGSHPISHERYIGNIDGITDFIKGDVSELNATDAGSLTLRVLSEEGVAGFGLMMGFIVWFWPRGLAPSRTALSYAILTYFLMKLLRSGIYFDPEEFFFISVYSVNGSHRLRRASLPHFAWPGRAVAVAAPTLSGRPGVC